MEKDEENVMCCLLSKKLGVGHTIARIRNREYLSAIDLIKDDLGLSMVINPDYMTASHIAQILAIPSVHDTTTFFKGKVQMISQKEIIAQSGQSHVKILSNQIDMGGSNIIVGE